MGFQEVTYVQYCLISAVKNLRNAVDNSEDTKAFGC